MQTKPIFAGAVLLLASGCGTGNREPTEQSVDCSVEDAYEFGRISYFDGNDSGWYEYADTTKMTLATAKSLYLDPNPSAAAVADLARSLGLAYQEATTPTTPGCHPKALHLEAYGYNFWGAGFADWAHNDPGAKADGTGYEGISFWARTAPNTDKTFAFYVDEGRTLVGTGAKSIDSIVIDNVCQYACTDQARASETPGWGIENAGTVIERECVFRGGEADTDVGCSKPPPAAPADDLNGDGFLGPGEIAPGTDCRVPFPQSVCDPACYYGGVQPPAAAPCVPAPDECGNQFHKNITTTDDWQLFLIPWADLAQWPCPNRLQGGINPADIRKFEIKVKQGTKNDIWIAHLAFYRQRAGN